MTISQDQTSPLDWARFEQLAQAYGAQIRRWPDAEQARARALAERDPVRAARVLADADQLDAWLALSPQPQPSASLTAAIRAAAPQPKTRRFLRFGLSGVFRAPIWSGAAAAAVCAGVLVGMSLGHRDVAAAHQDALSSFLQSETASADSSVTRGG